jgi:MraZ protein
VVSRFFGTYEHSLDAKGRAILPARFRGPMGAQAYVSKYQERCLAVWTLDEFEKQMADQEEKQVHGRSARNLARIWAAGSAEIDIDRQGRFAIPAHLREFAGLATENPILVIGALNRVELWNPAEWQQRVEPSEAELVGDLPVLVAPSGAETVASAEAP